jgi:hypothetical protein
VTFNGRLIHDRWRGSSPSSDDVRAAERRVVESNRRLLEKFGLAERRNVPQDRRVKLVVLTPRAPSIPTPLGQVRVARDVANDEIQDNTRASDEMSQTDRHTPGFPRRRSAKVHITKALSSLADSLTVRRRFLQHIVRELGEHDAILRCESARGKTKEQRSHERKTPQRGQRRGTEPTCTAPHVCHRAMAEADCSRDNVKEECDG